MALAKLKYLDSVEVATIATPILARVLIQFGFRDVQVEEVEDFDGEYIFRLKALVGQQVPAKLVIEAADAINSALRVRGELRFVNLSTQFRQPDESDDDEEE
jgi:regulator of RNase E activity RraB